MRVIGGSARGRRLRGPRGRGTRPTSDRVREALFNILAAEIAGARVLDCFAGTGALGIESLSRDAAFAVFIDRDPSCCRLIRRNLAELGWDMRAEIFSKEVVPALGHLAGERASFDLIFLDPPYRRDLLPPALAAVANGALLAANGWLVAEHDRREELPPAVGNLTKVSSRRYGETILSFFRRSDR